MTSTLWFFAEGNKQRGPVSVEVIRERYVAKAVTLDTLVWRDGLDNWKKLKDTELHKEMCSVGNQEGVELKKGSSSSKELKLRESLSSHIEGTSSFKHKLYGSSRSRRKNLPLIGTRDSVTEDESRNDIASRLSSILEDSSTSKTRQRRKAVNIKNHAIAPPPPPSILSCFVKGKGLKEAIEKASEYEICLFLPCLCLAIEATPIWHRNSQDSALSALEKRVAQSPRIAQSMVLILYSGSVKNPETFKNVSSALENSKRLGFLKWDAFPLNQFVHKQNRRKVKKGYILEAEHRVFHPFQPNVVIAKSHVETVFKTNSKPVLLSVLAEGKSRRPPIKIIMKQGDDFRQDVACMLVFRLFNHIWRESGIKHGNVPVRCHEYYTVATGINVGAIEYVENCIPLAEIQKMGSFSSDKIERLISTGAGSYIAAFLLGVRDRHDENIMIRQDGTMFHIDFGRAFGDAVLMDASSFAITKGFRDAIGVENYNSHFVGCCLKAFRTLRQPKNVDLLRGMVPTMFSAIHNADKIVNFLERTLMLKKDLESATMKFKKKIESAPDSYRTRFKNTMHKLAQATKGADN